ncbi:paraquat-inducible protein A [Bradyrhizobium sp.]|uniref:paraquat-inducible protein A n=1 Tax=Bradyrhizobium sp. TaxID=376 RepID=UPI0040380AFD
MGGTTPAELASGWERMIGPTTAVIIVLFGYVLFEPLVVTRIPFIRHSEIVLLRVARDLYQLDMFLFLVVTVFGILMPAVKLLGTALAWYFVDRKMAARFAPAFLLIGRLSMMDVMLLAVLVVAIKGIGIGSVEVRAGLYLYAALILGSLAHSVIVHHVIEQISKRSDSTD